MEFGARKNRADTRTHGVDTPQSRSNTTMTDNNPNRKNVQAQPDTPSEALDQLHGMQHSIEPCLTNSELRQLDAIHQVLREAIEE